MHASSAPGNGDNGKLIALACYTGSMSDTVSPGAPEHAMSNPDELRHTLTVEHVGALLTQAGVPRSRRQVIRYCQTGLLDAVKIPGPSGDQWYVSPASLPKAIGDLKQWGAQRERLAVTQLDMSSSVQFVSTQDQLKQSHNVNSDVARHGAPGPVVTETVAPVVEPSTDLDMASRGAPKHATSDAELRDVPSTSPSDVARQGMTELDIYEHPYVRRLEIQVEKLEGKLEAQVRRTEEIQSRSQDSLLELQRMTAVGQSQTLADFMLKARDWMIGKAPDANAPKEDVDNRLP